MRCTFQFSILHYWCFMLFQQNKYLVLNHSLWMHYMSTKIYIVSMWILNIYVRVSIVNIMYEKTGSSWTRKKYQLHRKRVLFTYYKTTVHIRNKEQYYSSVNKRGINQWQFSKTMCNLNCFCKNLNVIQKSRNGDHITTYYSGSNSVIRENAT